MKNIKHKIEQLLMVYPSMRDNRDHCIRKLLQENHHHSHEEVSIILLADRYWRKVQQDNPKLRGEKWGNRQVRKEEVAETIVKEGVVNEGDDLPDYLKEMGDDFNKFVDSI
jgi:hypothetical protein